MSIQQFGPGSVYLTRIDVGGGTPINIGFSNDFSLDESAETKGLFGEGIYALGIGSATRKLTGKCTMAVVSPLATSFAVTGAAVTAGNLAMARSEAAAVPAAGPYTYNAANAANFDTDLGVVYALTGLPLIRVSAAPAVGQYSVAAGIYTFAAADTGAAVKVTYAYKSTTQGGTVQAPNSYIGTSPRFQIDFTCIYSGKFLYLRIFNATMSKYTRNWKLNDFMMPTLDFECAQGPGGVPYEETYSEIS